MVVGLPHTPHLTPHARHSPVVIFSKSYCPYCTKAKAAFKGIGVHAQVIELDERDDCAAVQTELGKLTGATSVPRVFVGGKFVGGGDDTARLAGTGELKKLCDAAGAR